MQLPSLLSCSTTYHGPPLVRGQAEHCFTVTTTFVSPITGLSGYHRVLPPASSSLKVCESEVTRDLETVSDPDTMSEIRVRVRAADADPADPGVDVLLPSSPTGWSDVHSALVANAVGVD